MFNNKNNSSVSTMKFDGEKLDAIVSSDITIEGKFTSKGNIRLDCKIIGDVVSESLYIGNTGYIKGSVVCENVVTSGRIDGNLICKGKTHIKSTGIIDGDIEINILSMDEGATFTGKCTRISSAQMKSDKELKENNTQAEAQKQKSK